MQRPHETLKKLVVVIAIALSSNANAETFEQWVKNAGVHADKAMSPDQLRQFLTDYHASQGRNFDPNVIALDATAAAVQINMAIQRWLHNFGRCDEWNLCLIARTVVRANQERR